MYEVTRPFCRLKETACQTSQTLLQCTSMNQPRLDVRQLQRCEPSVWTALLQAQPEMEDICVTAVKRERFISALTQESQPNHSRYRLTLAGHSDPITLISKKTNEIEAKFYQDIAPSFRFLVPHCYLSQVEKGVGWVILEDVPIHFSPSNWSEADIEAIILDMVSLHTHDWGRINQWPWLPHFIDKHQITYTWAELRQQKAQFFEEGPASMLSKHALQQSGRMAPILLEAANGLTVLQSLGGWPGVLGESQLAAIADLLDDPLPMLAPLNELPAALLHGAPNNYHWHVTLFDERRLFDWQKVRLGPGILDLIYFTEQVNLVYAPDQKQRVFLRPSPPMSEETIVDSYLLAMTHQLGKQFDARAVRQAIPAARCLYILSHWLPHFATWFSDMPDKYVWQRLNRMSDTQLINTPLKGIIALRPYLQAAFRRFLQAYRML